MLIDVKTEILKSIDLVACGKRLRWFAFYN